MASIQCFSYSNEVDSLQNPDKMESAMTGTRLNLQPELDQLSVNLLCIVTHSRTLGYKIVIPRIPG